MKHKNLFGQQHQGLFKPDLLKHHDSEQIKESMLLPLIEIAQALKKLYVRLDNHDNIFTHVTHMLEKLFFMHHRALYDDYLNKHNFVSEVNRFADTSHAALQRGTTFTMESMMPSSSASSSNFNHP